MLIFIIASLNTSVLMTILVGSLLVLFESRIVVLVKRHKGKEDTRANTITMVILYVLIIAVMLIYLIIESLLMPFVCCLLLLDFFLWRYFPVMDQGEMGFDDNRCDLCSDTLYGSGAPHIFGSHKVCRKCHIIIEEAKKEEGVV
ncbi:MAG: hypothetical protein ACYSWP_00795 [Planctomycetota bacterium]|jgi:hypothetical protein